MTAKLEFSPDAKQHYEWLLTRYPHQEAVLLPAIRLAEEEFGNLGAAELLYVAEVTGLPPARVFGVFTFYTHYRRPGTGKYHLQVCSTLSCALRGSEELCEHLKKKLDIDIGETTEDGLFTVSKVECLASCDTAPMLQCNADYHENLTLDDVDELIDRLRNRMRNNGGSG